MQHGKLEWFGGNEDALRMYNMFVELAHTWDDLVDKDQEVTDDRINKAFLITLVYLQTNPFYRRIQDHIIPMWLATVTAYETSNYFEREKDPHGIEIAHNLRYTAGHIIAYAIQVCVGIDKAKEYIPEMWKNVVFERFDNYRKEHLND